MRYLLAIMAALCCTACSESSVTIDEIQPSSPISFNHLTTRGRPLVAGDGVPSINIVAYQGDVEYIEMQSLESQNLPINTEWAYFTDKYWPSDKSTVDFFAITPSPNRTFGISNVVHNSDSLSLSYLAPFSADSQPDLMVAYTSGKSGDTPTLDFKHTLAAISFSVRGDSSRRITAVAMKGVNNSGTLTFYRDGTFAWSNLRVLATSLNPILDTSVIPSEDAQLITTAEGYIMTVPQTVETNDEFLAVTVTDADGSSNSEVIEIPLTSLQIWQAGEIYNYIITID